MLFFTLGVD
jgi:hypothetical protein